MTTKSLETKIRTCNGCGSPLDLPTGRELREAREAMGLSRDAFAALLNITSDAVRTAERGQSNPSPEMCRLLNLNRTGGVIRITDPKVATTVGGLLTTERILERSVEEMQLLLRQVKALIAEVKGEG